MLLAEGFQDEGYLDIFDGGPTLVAPIDAVATVAASRELAYLGEQVGGAPALVAMGHGGHFRLVRGFASSAGGGVRLDPASAELLDVAVGDLLQIAMEATVQ